MSFAAIAWSWAEMNARKPGRRSKVSRRRVARLLRRVKSGRRKFERYLQGRHDRWSIVAHPEFVAGWNHQVPLNGRQKLSERARQQDMLRKLLATSRAIVNAGRPE